MDFSGEWTSFALDAEVEHFGTGRIAKAHNEEVSLLARQLNESNERNGRLRAALKRTLLELEQWNLTEGDYPAATIIKDGFKLLKDLGA